MKVKHLELGTMVKENVIGVEGMLTHFQRDMSGNMNYQFQPAALNPENGQPVEAVWTDTKRITGGVEIETELPVEILGSIVTDKATKFTGTAVSMVLHINGCVHFAVKPSGLGTKTGSSVRMADFDIRRLEGEKIPVLSKEEIQKSQKETPSPAETHPFVPGGE